jgi:hypothetical protein
MSSTTSNTKASALARVLALIAGMQKHLPNGSFTLGGVAFTEASLTQELQSLADAMAKRDAADTGAKDARKAVKDTTAKVGPLMRDFKRIVLAAFESNAQTLADFGLLPPKVRKPLPAEKRAAATAKVRATRKARGTTSKKQKLGVRGNVTGVEVIPITQPASPSPAQPASSTSGTHTDPVNATTK